MNSVRDVNITDRAKTLLRVTQEQWSCSAPSTRTKVSVESAPASTTARGGHANQKAISLKPSDPYPTWPFTQVEPKSLARWCKKNLGQIHQIEEAPY